MERMEKSTTARESLRTPACNWLRVSHLCLADHQLQGKHPRVSACTARGAGSRPSGTCNPSWLPFPGHSAARLLLLQDHLQVRTGSKLCPLFPRLARIPPACLSPRYLWPPNHQLVTSFRVATAGLQEIKGLASAAFSSEQLPHGEASYALPTNKHCP